MGNVDSRSKFAQGYLQLQTDKHIYEPGEMITGSIYLRVEHPIHNATHVQLEVKGKEKASWTHIV
jgi:hypothetical protein